MKNSVIIFLFSLLFTGGVYAQQGEGFKLGGSLALSVGNFGNAAKVGFQADATYHFEVADNFYVGPSGSLFYYIGKSNFKDWLFLPLSADARYDISEFYVGLNLGYGIGLAPSGNNGGFYFRPKVGYYLKNANIGLLLSYSGISVKGGTAGSFNLGVEFGL